MAIAEALLPDYDQEVDRTRKMLEVVPNDKLDWKPHEKSMTLGRLATHLCEMPGWGQAVLALDEFDMAPPDAEPYRPPTVNSSAEILEMFNTNAAKARELIASMSDADFMKTWTLKKAGEKVFSAPRAGVVRDILMSHMAHHRGQLSVYLRLNDVPIPQSYGPTADYPDM